MDKILIVKIAAIGDVVMALPMLTYLRRTYPRAVISWICGMQVAPLLETIGLLDEVILIDEQALLKGALHKRCYALCKIWAKLRMQRFDLIITGHSDPRYRLISAAARAKKRVSFHRKKRPFPLPGRYHAHEYLRLVTGLESGPGPDLIFQTVGAPRERQNMIVLAPGGAKNILSDDLLRRWPITHYAALMKQLQGLSVQLIVVGAHSDSWVLPFLSGISFENRIGKLSLLELLELFKQAKLLITHDSGPLHVAKLAECPTIALFGPTNPNEKVGPNEKITVLRESLSCQPCYDGKHYAACKDPVCLKRITPERVFELTKNYVAYCENSPCS